MNELVATRAGAAGGSRRRPGPRVLDVVAVERPTPNVARITLAGGDATGLIRGAPDDCVRVYFPAEHGGHPVLPGRAGRRGQRPIGGVVPIGRDYTPRFAPTGLQLDLVLHGRGPAATWAEGASVGERLAVTGPHSSRRDRGGSPPPPAGAHRVLAGDESALPAIRELLACLPGDVAADVFVEVAGLEDMQDLATEALATVRWIPRRRRPHGEQLIDAVREATLRLGQASVWVAAETATARVLRDHFVAERGVAPSRVSSHSYWTLGPTES